MFNIDRKHVVNGAFTALAVAGAATAMVSGVGPVLIGAAILTESGLAAIGCEGTKTFLNYLDRKGNKSDKTVSA